MEKLERIRFLRHLAGLVVDDVETAVLVTVDAVDLAAEDQALADRRLVEPLKHQRPDIDRLGGGEPAELGQRPLTVLTFLLGIGEPLPTASPLVPQ